MGGITRQERVPKFVEALEVMKHFWTREEVHHEGRYCSVHGTRMGLRPYQQPHPPLWIAAHGHAARVAYNQGALEIMAPSYAHEQLNILIAMIISFIAAEMDIDFENAGSTTFKRADLGRGFEPDSCFYIQHVAAIRGKATIDWDTAPPPDLVLDIDLTHPSLDKLPIYAVVGVPEVWRYTNDHLVMYRLTEGTYTVVEMSGVLPNVACEDIQHWIEVSQQMPRATWMKQGQGWAQHRRTP